MLGSRQWNSVNNIGVYTDTTRPRRFQRKKKSVQNGDVTNGVVTNGDANHEGEEEIPNVEAPIDNEEEQVNGAGAAGEDEATAEDVAVAENGDVPLWLPANRTCPQGEGH